MNTLLQKIFNQAQYIAWSNFLDGRILLQWVWALLLLLLLLWSAWGWGAIAVGPRLWRWANERILVTLATGLAVIVPLLFLAALCGGYSLPVVGVIWLLGLAAPSLLSRRPLALVEGPIAMGRAVAEMPIMWGALVLFSIAALLPPTHWDEVMYHLPYPLQWISARRLTVDPYAWYPFYTWNWELLQGVGLMVGSESLIHLLGWFTGALATVAVRVFALRLGVRPWLAVIAAAAFAITPTTQHYLDSGMIDIPLMCFLVVATYAFTLIPKPEGEADSWRDWLPAALCSGMFVGMKITGMVYIPLFGALGIYRLRRRAGAFLVVFALSGVTWYAYNFVRSGDPAPPLFSLLLHRDAMYWNAEDVAWHEADHARGRLHGVGQVLDLPVRLVRKPPPPGAPPPPLYDGPLLGYILLFPLSLIALRAAWRLGLPEPMVAGWYGAAIFVATSTLLVRYATFLPLAVVGAIFVVERATGWIERRRRVPQVAVLAVATLLVVGPTPYGLLAARDNLHFRIPRTGAEREELQRSVEPALNALRELRRLAPAGGRVYLTQNGLRYDYMKAGYPVVGNATHPGRFPDFRRALLADTGSRFLANFGVDYLVVDKPYVEFYVGLSPAQVAAATSVDSGFVMMYDDSAATIYRVAAPRVPKAATRIGAAQRSEAGDDSGLTNPFRNPSVGDASVTPGAARCGVQGSGAPQQRASIGFCQEIASPVSGSCAVV